jgi:hypothetical protein
MTEPANTERARHAARALEAFRDANDHERLSADDVVPGLLTGLRHLSDRQGIDFEEALTASSRAYAEQRRSEEHPYRVGQEVQIRDGAVLSPSLTTLPSRGVVAALYPGGISPQAYAIRFPGEMNAMPFIGSEIEPAPPFPPVRTLQGAVCSLTDAEDALIRAAARIRMAGLSGGRPTRSDVQDQRLLTVALGEICNLTPEEMLRQVELRVAARVQQDLATRAADDLGRTVPVVAAAQLADRDFPQGPGESRSVVLGAADPAGSHHLERRARGFSPRVT